MRPWVTNASPLIFLSKLGRLALLKNAADEILVPTAVIQENQQYGDRAASEVAVATQDWLEPIDTNSSPLLKLLQTELGPGEAAALALASEVQASRVVLDDLEGRRWARKLDMEVVGTLGLLLAGKLRGEISSLREAIESLRAVGFRASEPLIAALLEQAGESRP